MSISGPLPAQTALYRTVWRWHFLAGLFALPFLLNLAITGGLYLFAPEINHILYRALEDVPARAEPLSASVLVQKAADSTQGEVMGLTLPSGADRSVEMLIRTGEGESRTAYVDPYDGRLLGTIPVGGVMLIVRQIHSLIYFGFWASCLVEIAAGWAIVLALSGIFLWWPRGRTGGVVTVRGKPKYRMFWRDLHAVTGLFVSSIIVFLAVTGMPWSMLWGKYVQKWTTAVGLGQPQPQALINERRRLALVRAARRAYERRRSALAAAVATARGTLGKSSKRWPEGHPKVSRPNFKGQLDDGEPAGERGIFRGAATETGSIRAETGSFRRP